MRWRGEEGSDPSAPFDKVRMAFRAMDTDPALPSGDPDLLSAAGAFIDMISPGLDGLGSPLFGPFGHQETPAQITLIFPKAGGDVPGEHAEVAIK